MAEEGPAGATPGVLHKIVLCTMQNIYCVESAEMFLMLCTPPEKNVNVARAIGSKVIKNLKEIA